MNKTLIVLELILPVGLYQIREVLEKFLDDDGDMKSMNLTAKL